ncbi:MBL fold metallo-hydrolase [Geothrix sp. PMB-07]|uniref:MBL fold metallo-hydrolase n=1 Tax=Geothrix sp. PMB-07 TaxID=3068640 RepID=UPI0027417778|nr:MBL fold metallo-hydrolase [Geothrix sp. PMB-07]WLT30686.1 MBL fold metallo-hydrolase [Geothrix sp. PMB-07]
MRILTALGFAAALASALPLAAHAKHQAKESTAPKIHKIEKVAENVYCIFGQGGNVGLIVTANHAILIDDQFERLVPGLVEAVRSVTPKPIKYLINTHGHGDHVGGNVVLEKQVMAIVAHANVRKAMIKEQAKLEPAKRGGLPELALGSEDAKERARLDIHLDGTDLHLLHLGPGHTDGDIIVGLPAVPVLHMGDLFFLGMLPYIDVEGGGSFDGLASQIAAVASWVPDNTRIIPGHGPVCGKPELLRYRDLLLAIQAHVKANPAKDGPALAASFDTATWPEWKPRPEFVTWETLFSVASGKGPGRVSRP